LNGLKAKLTFSIIFRRHTRDGGYPVRRSFAVLLQASLEYWVTRWNLSSGSPKATPGGGVMTGVYGRQTTQRRNKK
jgi:hypothetical protein